MITITETWVNCEPEYDEPEKIFYDPESSRNGNTIELRKYLGLPLTRKNNEKCSCCGFHAGS